MDNLSGSQQIDSIISSYDNWRSQTMAQIRSAIVSAHPSIVEEVKWKTASRPAGLPVWSHQGIVCFGEIWKDNVKLLFQKGAQLADADSSELFNARLNSATVRAIEFREGDPIDHAGIKELVLEAIALNQSKS